MATFFILVPICAVYIITSHAAGLTEMPVYTLQDANTYYLKAEYCTISTSEFTMNGRCYSFSEDGKTYSVPSSPGPTLKMTAGQNVKIELINNFKNTQQDVTTVNGYHNLDSQNLHLHGVHIQSRQDDILVEIKPQTQHQYEYDLPPDHYPGIHWYHPHKHGAVAYQIHSGLFGAFITETPPSNYPDPKLYDDGSTSEHYKTNILMFSSMYLVETEQCNCNTVTDDVSAPYNQGTGAYGRCIAHGKSCFHIYSLCFEWCQFATHGTSGMEYSASTKEPSGVHQYFLVNGDVNPTVESVSAGAYRRLLFVNAVSQYYIHYNLPDECEWNLLGYDGIFFGAHRDLKEFENELLLAPGSRADLLVKCDDTGTYQITTISDGETAQNNVENFLDGLERAGSDSVKSLFVLEVVNNGDDTIDELPFEYPTKPDYLQDLLDADADDHCACNTYEAYPDGICDGDHCCIQYNSKTAMMVNGATFSDTGGDYMTYMIQDGIYEYELKTDRHVHHQHTYPFQLTHDVANGFIAKEGDWFDTFGAEGTHVMRFKTADFGGYVVNHCHILPHEDKGMMRLSYVIASDALEATEGLGSCLDDLINDWIQSTSDSVDSAETPSPPPSPPPIPAQVPTRKPKGNRGGRRGIPE
eukprot:324730_1